MQKNIIFHIDGGFGKNIAATAVCSAIKNNYPDHKLVVVAPYPEAFINNPSVDRIYKSGNVPYFYEDYIENKETKIFRQEPYFAESHILQKKHLIETWCDVFNIKYNGEPPALFFNKREINYAINNFKIDLNKPVFVLQTSGGAENQSQKFSWSRDISPIIAQKVVNNIQSAFNNNAQIFHIRRENQIGLNNVKAVTAPLRNLCALIFLSNKRLLIDSFGQHCAAACNKPSTVCWIANKPEIFGYNIHNNLTPPDDKSFTHRVDSYLEEYEWTGSRLHECPYDVDNIFDADKISKDLLYDIL
jgi:hypothetical protein